jgi:hypothetical protein
MLVRLAGRAADMSYPSGRLIFFENLAIQNATPKGVDAASDVP